MAAEVKFDQRKARRGHASKPFRAAEFEGLTGSSAVVLARAGSSKHPSGNPFSHDMAGGRPVGEKLTRRVEQSAFGDGHLPTDV
jgi:hypothetical protein